MQGRKSWKGITKSSNNITKRQTWKVDLWQWDKPQIWARELSFFVAFSTRSFWIFLLMKLVFLDDSGEEEK
jgi:hypothetical protein